MTKQPPYVSRLRLSRICRWLLTLGVVKLCIFGALVAGYPLPELSWDILRGTVNTESADTQNTQPEAKPDSTLAAMDSLLGKDVTSEKSDATAAMTNAPQAVRPVAVTAVAAAPQREDPQGAAAARAAATLENVAPHNAVSGLAAVGIPAPSIATAVQEGLTAPSSEGVTALGPESVTAPSSESVTALGPESVTASATGNAALVATTAPQILPGQPLMTASAVTDTTTTQDLRSTDDKSWWSHILQLKALPFPRMGVDQVAHAATLDTPPPPSRPTPTGADRTSAFTPPSQIPSGVNADGSPIPPRSTTAQPRPAGTSGPQFDTAAEGQGNSIPSMLTPTSNVPTPKTDAYVAPEDPNRKQQELARREQEVLVLKQQMEQRLEELQAAERKVQGLLEEAKEMEAKKSSRLAAIYINMKPKQAAKAIESMDERTAVKILAGMSPKQSGEILTYADPKKTAKLTELISRMRTGQ